MKKNLSDLSNNKTFMGLVFILPALLGTLIFIIIPVIFSFGLSFVEWDLLTPAKNVAKELMSIPSFDIPDYSEYMSEEKEVIKNLKKVFLVV